jgi:hypothetical protein
LYWNTTGGDNSALGVTSLNWNTTGSFNTSVGNRSLFNNTTSNNNVAVGYESGLANTTGTNNTFLGYKANADAGTYSNSTALGANALITASNQLVLGGTGTTEVYIPFGNLNIVNNCSALSYTTTSDYRVKQNVKTINNANFTVDNLRPVTYTNILSEKQDIGLIAHELQEQYPFLVTGEKDGTQNQSVNYTGLIPILIKEIQELKERVKTLESNQPS